MLDGTDQKISNYSRQSSLSPHTLKAKRALSFMPGGSARVFSAMNTSNPDRPSPRKPETNGDFADMFAALKPTDNPNTTNDTPKASVHNL